MIKINYIIILTIFLNFNLFAQKQDLLQKEKQSSLDIKTTGFVTNTFLSYNQNIINNKDFKFRKAIRNAKQANLILEYISEKERILMSKVDYLKTLKKVLNQSESTEIFIKKMQKLFPSQSNQFIRSLKLDLLYDHTRRLTFNGYLDELPHFN